MIDRTTAQDAWRQHYIDKQVEMGDGLFVRWWRGIPNFRLVDIIDHSEGQAVTLTPKHALILLKWLEEERVTLEELAAKDARQEEA